MTKPYHICCQSATTIIHFIVTTKTLMATKSIFDETAIVNLNPNTEVESGNCQRKDPSFPVCEKASFPHHNYECYSNYRCGNKKCLRYVISIDFLLVRMLSINSFYLLPDNLLLERFAKLDLFG